MKKDVSNERDDQIPGFLASMLYAFIIGVFLTECLGKRIQARVNVQTIVGRNEINYGSFGIAK